MIRSFYRQLRRVYLPEWAVIGIVLCAFPEVLRLGCTVALGVPAEVTDIFLQLRDMMVILLCAVYGVTRGYVFHPLLPCSGYFDWLRQTPWTSSRPLPFGSPFLLWHDIVFLALMRSLLHGYHFAEWLIPLVFLAAYLAVLPMELWRSGSRLPAYAIYFGLGAAVKLYWWHPGAALAFLIVMYGLAAVALHHSLSRFPWTAYRDRLFAWLQLRPAAAGRENVRKNKPLELTPADLGWPFKLLHAQPEVRLLKRSDSWSLSLLAGWLTYLPLSHWANRDQAEVSLVLIGFTLVCVLVRVARYCSGHLPPISLWGRLWTGRWLIPAYDRVFATPLVTLLIGISGSIFVAGSWSPLGNAVTSGIIVAMVLLTTLLFGPNCRRWQLTCPCRLFPGTARTAAGLQER